MHSGKLAFGSVRADPDQPEESQMYGVDYRYQGEDNYRELSQRFDTEHEAQMAADDLVNNNASVEEAVVTVFDPFETER